MAIRSRYTSASAGTSSLPAFLIQGEWPGVRAWLFSVMSSSLLFALLAGFAWHGTNARVSDMTTFFVAVPCGMLVSVLFVAMLWSLLARIPFDAGLMFLARLLPLSVLFPLIDLVRSGGQGITMSGVILDAPQYLLASVSAAVLPMESLIPIGMRVGLLAVVLVSAFVVWFTRRDIIRSVIVALLTSVIFVKVTFLASALGVWHALTHGEGWVTGLTQTSREAVRAVTNGYWWPNIYDRFPSAVEQQADISMRLTTAGIIALVLGLLLVMLLVWQVKGWKRLLAHAFYALSALDVALYAVGAAIATTFGSRAPVPGGSWWYALPLALLVLAAFRLAAVLERCREYPRSTDPLVCGELSAQLSEDVSFIASGFALIGSFALGWPVFVAMVVAISASRLSRDRLWVSFRWSPLVFRCAGAASLVMAGFFFATQHARFTPLAGALVAVAIIHRVGMELLRTEKRPMIQGAAE